MHDAFKLKAGNNEPIRHEWYPPHITVVDNTGEALETSSFKFRLAKKLEKQAKSMYCDKTANFEYQFNNFTEFQLDVLIVLNIFVGERNLEPTPQLAATDPNRQVEDFFTVLKFIFSTQRNSSSVTDFLISNLLLHAERLIRQSEAWKLCWNYQKRCRILRKVQICLHISVGIYKDIFAFVNCLWNMLLVVLTQSLSHWLYLLLFYYLVLGLKAQCDQCNWWTDLVELGFEFEKLERFNLETATGGAL